MKRYPVAQALMPATAPATSEEIRAAELRTTRELHYFSLDLLNLRAEHFGGDTTLNHLRVGVFIGLCSQHEGKPTCNSEIAQQLDLSRATVSRIVGDFVQSGWVKEEPHPDDGRRRHLVITPHHPDGDRFERAFRERLNKLLDDYAAGTLVRVESTKKSYSE